MLAAGLTFVVWETHVYQLNMFICVCICLVPYSNGTPSDNQWEFQDPKNGSTLVPILLAILLW